MSAPSEPTVAVVYAVTLACMLPLATLGLAVCAVLVHFFWFLRKEDKP